MATGLVTTCVALVLFTAVSVMAGEATDNVQLTLGQFAADESVARQALVVRNDGPDAFNIMISCGFLRGDVAVAEAHQSVLNVNQAKPPMPSSSQRMRPARPERIAGSFGRPLRIFR
jgi:hypothetical protein